jgi:hypothetical protein
MRVNLKHHLGREVSAEIFHVFSGGLDVELEHLIGVCEVREDGAGPDESLFSGTIAASALPAAQLQDASGARQRRTSVRHSRSGRSLAGSSASSEFSSTGHTKRELVGLEKIVLKLRLTGSEMRIQEYNLSFVDALVNKEKAATNHLPDLYSCVPRSKRDSFQKLVQDSVNDLTMMSNDVAHHVELPGEIVFRPPTLSCASAKVLLCAESARLKSNLVDHIDDDGDFEDETEWFELQLRGISQLSPCYPPPGSHVSQHELAPLPETTDEE